MDQPRPTELRPSAALRALSAFIPGAAAAVCLGLAAIALSRADGSLTPGQWLCFVALPLIAAVGLARIARSAPSRRVGPTLSIVATGAALVVAEITLSVVPLIIPEAGSEYTVAVLLDSLREAGIVAYPAIPGSVLVARNATVVVGTETVHPLSPAPPHTTVVLCHEPDGASVSYPGDRFGFNNPDSVWTHPDPDVVLVGDSFTQGVCVQPDDNIAGSMSPGRTVVNLGLRGSGPLVQLGVAREYAAGLEPEVMAWIYYEGNDPTDLINETAVPWLTSYLDPEYRQGLAASGPAVGERYAAWIDSLLTTTPDRAGAAGGIRGRPGALSVLKLGRLRQATGFDNVFPTRAPGLPRLEEALGAAAALAESWGGRLVLVYIPSERRFRGWFPEDALGRGRVGAVADSLRVPLIDMIPVFEETGDPLSHWSRPGGHLSPYGYGVVARELEDFLSDPAGG